MLNKKHTYLFKYLFLPYSSIPPYTPYSTKWKYSFQITHLQMDVYIWMLKYLTWQVRKDL